MTDNEIRIAIAEACGIPLEAIEAWRDWDEANRQYMYAEIGCEEYYARHLRKELTVKIPDYLNDLNAMREAEETLIASYQLDFVYYLKEIACPITGEDWMAIHATARQRAEAFLRTIGKWKD